MAEIFLIRHGQASFGSDDYDQLSKLGHKQCEMLGHSMSSALIKAPLYVLGELKRHRQSFDAFRGCVEHTERLVNSTSADILVLPELNEFDHENVLHVAFPEFEDKSVLATELARSDRPKSRFHQLFEQAITRWTSGELDDQYLESWAYFNKRVQRGFSALRDLTQMPENKGRPLLVFTSGGPIAAICKEVMGLSTEATFALNENLTNSGVTRILTSNNRSSISFINNYSHLENKLNLISYR